MKKFLSILLAVLMIVSSAAIIANAEDDDNLLGELSLGTTKINVGDSGSEWIGYYTFTADKEGYYTFTNDNYIDTWHGSPENFYLSEYIDSPSSDDCEYCGYVTSRVFDDDDNCLLVSYLNSGEEVFVNLSYMSGDIEITINYEGTKAECIYDDSACNFIDGLDASSYIDIDSGETVYYFAYFPATLSFESGNKYSQSFDWYCSSAKFSDSGETADATLDSVKGISASFTANIHNIDEYIKEVTLPEDFSASPVKYYDDTRDSEIPDYVNVVFTDGTTLKITSDESDHYATMGGKTYPVYFMDDSYTNNVQSFGVYIGDAHMDFVYIYASKTFEIKDASVSQNFSHYISEFISIINFYAEEDGISFINRIKWCLDSIRGITTEFFSSLFSF